MTGLLYLPDDMATDHPERFIIGEIIREKLLRYLDREVPRSIFVEIESYEKSHNAEIGRYAVASQSIIIGKVVVNSGRGQERSRGDETAAGHQVFLSLWVKVRH